MPENYITPPDEVSQRSLLGEQLIRLNEVRKLLPPRSDGRRVALSTVYRWCHRGVRGVRLETMRGPWGRMTSIEAVERFLLALNKDRPQELTITPARRRRQKARAAEELRQALGGEVA